MGPQCPKCGKEFVRRAHREGALERLLSLAYIYPFRCQLCTHRFRTCQWGIRYSKQPRDHREYARVETRFPVTFSGDETSGNGMVTLVSMGGCAIETETKLSPGAILQLQLQTSDREPAVTVDAVVVRSVRSKSVGLQFLRLGMEEKERLGQFVRCLLMSRPPFEA
jgi:hypothetical protein